MKHYFLCLIFFSLWAPEAAISAPKKANPTDAPHEPTVDFPSKYLRQLSDATTALKAKGKLTCTQLLNKTWAYPNALVTPFCYAAETNCISLNLLKNAMSTATGQELENMKKSHAFLIQNVYMNLYTCVQALEASLTNNSSVLPPLGYYAPFQSITPSAGN